MLLSKALQKTALDHTAQQKKLLALRAATTEELPYINWGYSYIMGQFVALKIINTLTNEIDFVTSCIERIYLMNSGLRSH